MVGGDSSGLWIGLLPGAHLERNDVCGEDPRRPVGSKCERNRLMYDVTRGIVCNNLTCEAIFQIVLATIVVEAACFQYVFYIKVPLMPHPEVL